MKRPSVETSARRRFLQAGTLALFAGAAPVSRARGFSLGSTDAAASFGRAKRCILVYLLGGPPQIDMWDMKPDAPAEIRGPFRPIQSAVPGMHFCEHLPRLASRAGDVAILRSVTYPNNDHPLMIYHTLTGRPSRVPLGANTVLPPSRSDDPAMGAVVWKFKHREAGVPGYVAIPEVQVRMKSTPVSGGGRAGFLGAAYDPLAISDDPSSPPAGLKLPDDVSTERFAERQSLLAVLDGQSPRAVVSRDYQTFRRSASRLIGSAADGMFALAREPEPMRERYGRHRFGQSLLLARRLVERGVSFVGVHFNHMTKCDGWDTHNNNFDALKSELLPLVDQGLSALIEDLRQRGMLDDTLVVTLGEFGRTPRINKNAGRDHWGSCASVLLAGGGIAGGRLVGASDKICAYPCELPVAPADVVATIYHCLGLAPHTLMHDPQGRPLTIAAGNAIRQLF
jgi:Protein of unknown function (DUF1501)